jgi:hypothetical protein
MSEAEFWPSLEYRVCREFAGMQNWDLRHYWCDGFIPERYHLTGQNPRITGQAWICYGQRQEPWKFTLLLPRPVNTVEEMVWQSLLLPENMTRWLALDQKSQHIEIDPGVAVPELK